MPARRAGGKAWSEQAYGWVKKRRAPTPQRRCVARAAAPGPQAARWGAMRGVGGGAGEIAVDTPGRGRAFFPAPDHLPLPQVELKRHAAVAAAVELRAVLQRACAAAAQRRAFSAPRSPRARSPRRFCAARTPACGAARPARRRCHVAARARACVVHLHAVAAAGARCAVAGAFGHHRHPHRARDRHQSRCAGVLLAPARRGAPGGATAAGAGAICNPAGGTHPAAPTYARQTARAVRNRRSRVPACAGRDGVCAGAAAGVLRRHSASGPAVQQRCCAVPRRCSRGCVAAGAGVPGSAAGGSRRVPLRR